MSALWSTSVVINLLLRDTEIQKLISLNIDPFSYSEGCLHTVIVDAEIL